MRNGDATVWDVEISYEQGTAGVVLPVRLKAEVTDVATADA
jgi:hypothetical protein